MAILTLWLDEARVPVPVAEDDTAETVAPRIQSAFADIGANLPVAVTHGRVKLGSERARCIWDTPASPAIPVDGPLVPQSFFDKLDAP
jgi:hypothetical protein